MTQRTGYEKFQQQAFDELDELEEAERDRTVSRFVELGKQCGVDVAAEILDKRKSVAEVFAAIDEKRSNSKRVTADLNGSRSGRSARASQSCSGAAPSCRLAGSPSP